MFAYMAPVDCRQQLAEELTIRKVLRADHAAAVAARRSAQQAAQQQRWQQLAQRDVLRAEARAAAAREAEEAEAEQQRYVTCSLFSGIWSGVPCLLRSELIIWSYVFLLSQYVASRNIHPQA